MERRKLRVLDCMVAALLGMAMLTAVAPRPCKAATYEEAIAKSNEAFGWCIAAEYAKNSCYTPGNEVVGKHLANYDFLLTVPNTNSQYATLWGTFGAMETELTALGAKSYQAELEWNQACAKRMEQWQTYAESVANSEASIVLGKSSAKAFQEVHNDLIGGDAQYGAAAKSAATALCAREDDLNGAIETALNP